MCGQAFRDEAQIWWNFDHENILKFVGVCVYDNCLSIVSPWMENDHLVAYIAKEPFCDRAKFVSPEWLGEDHGFGQRSCLVRKRQVYHSAASRPISNPVYRMISGTVCL